jgi:tRNA (guanine-N7-)-methyltransferase
MQAVFSTQSTPVFKQTAGERMDIEIRLSQFEQSLSWTEVFGNPNPVVCEIGSGKGRFLISSATANPSLNYLGIERAVKYHRLIRERVERQCLGNVRLLNCDAAHFVRTYVPPLSVQHYYILFPDPWPKKRHRKRRLVTHEFLEALLPTLATGGGLHYKTDFEDYFEQMLNVTRSRPELAELQCRTITAAQVEPEAAETNFERKYLIQGRLIYAANYRKA